MSRITFPVVVVAACDVEEDPADHGVLRQVVCEALNGFASGPFEAEGIKFVGPAGIQLAGATPATNWRFLTAEEALECAHQKATRDAAELMELDEEVEQAWVEANSPLIFTVWARTKSSGKVAAAKWFVQASMDGKGFAICERDEQLDSNFIWLNAETAWEV